MQSDKLPMMPEPYGVIVDGTPGILTFQRAPLTQDQALYCSSDVVYSRADMRAYALAARKEALEQVRAELERRYAEHEQSLGGSYEDGQKTALDVFQGWVEQLMEQDA